MVNWQGTKPGTFVNNSTIEPVSAENLNAVVNTIDKIATGGKDSGLNADTIRDIDFDALATTSDETLTNFYSFDSLVGASNEILLDDSGLNYHGTAYNITLVKGLISMAGSFNGTSSYASCPYANKAALTVAMWYKGTESVEKPLFLLKRANNAVKIGIYINDGCAEIKFLNSDSVLQTITDTSIINNNKFHHIAVSHTGTSCHLYVDGILRQSLNQTLTPLYYNQAIIGASEEVTPVTFTAGTIDDARIYSSALSQNEVYGIYFNKINTKATYKPTIADIPTLAGKITPLSDLNRVFHLTGNGIPTFPDNVAGTVSRQNNFSAIPSGWIANNSPTSTFSNGIWKVTANGAYAGYYRPATSGLDVIKLRVLAGSVNVDFADGSAPIKSFIPSGSWQYAQTYSSTGSALRILAGADASTVYEIADIYIGSGLYDTPVYGADGKSVWTNHGVLAAPGERGNAMLFQGNGALQSDNPEVGANGTLRFKFKTPATLTSGFIFSNKDSIGGLHLYQNDGGVTDLSFGGISYTTNLGSFVPSTKYTFSISFSSTELNIYKNGALFSASTLTSAPIASQTNFTIGADPSLNNKQSFTLYDIKFVAETETLDSHIRYHNGDDAVDSQQKSATGTPNAIATYANDGFLGEHGTFTPVLSFGNASTGITYEYRSGVYNRLGRTVLFQISMKLSSKGSSVGNMKITGLPYVSSNVSYAPVTVAYNDVVQYNGQLSAYINTNSTDIFVVYTQTTGYVMGITNTNLGDTSFMMISGFYFID